VSVFLGVDIGTYEAKGVVLDEAGRVVASARRRHELSVPRPGLAEHDAEDVWWAGFVAVVGELLGHASVTPEAIAGVGCSGIGPCVLPLDAERQPLRPAILYGVDTRARRQCESLTEQLGEAAILTRTGAALTSQAAGPKVAWVRDEEPEVYGRTDLCVTCQGFLVGRLTGRWTMDHATAAYYGPCYTLAEARWDPAWTEASGAGGLLPELRWSTDVVGQVTGEAAAATGLASGTPVIAGAPDAPAEAVAAGVTRPGDLMIMYGSTMFMIEVLETLATDPRMWAAPYVFEGSYIMAGGTSTAGTATRWWLDLLDRSGDDEATFARLIEEADAVAPGSDGLIALPHFSGERTPLNDPGARGVISGLDLTHGRGHVFRALLEGIATGVRWNVDVLGEVGAAPRRVRAVGGGTRNPVWTQAISDSLGLRQEVVTSSAAHGSALLAAVGVGALKRADLDDLAEVASVIEPRAAHRETYDRLSEAARRLYEAVRNTREDT
jgi:xylulokinase